MARKVPVVATFSLMVLTVLAALAPTVAGEVTADKVIFYLEAEAAQAGNLVLTVPTAEAASNVDRTASAPFTSHPVHTWQAGSRVGNMTVTASPTLTIFVEVAAGTVPTQPLGNPGDANHGPDKQKFWLRAKVFFGATESAFAWAEIAPGAGPKELTVELTISGTPLDIPPTDIVKVETTVFAFQPSGVQSSYSVNSTATPSRLEVPGTIAGAEIADPGNDGNETANETGNDTVDNETAGNGDGNSTDNNATANDTEPAIGAKDSGDEKKKSGGLPGFETVLVVIGGAIVALVRRNRRRGAA